MAFIDQYTLGANKKFISVVHIAILKVATQIAGESIGNLQDAYYTKRQALANAVFGNTENEAKKFAMHVVSGGNILATVNNHGDIEYSGSSTLDSDIEFTITAIWDDRSGVIQADLQEKPVE